MKTEAADLCVCLLVCLRIFKNPVFLLFEYVKTKFLMTLLTCFFLCVFRPLVMPRQSTTIIPVGLESLYKSTTRKMEWSMGRFKKTTLAGGTTSVSQF